MLKRVGVGASVMVATRWAVLWRAVVWAAERRVVAGENRLNRLLLNDDEGVRLEMIVGCGVDDGVVEDVDGDRGLERFSERDVGRPALEPLETGMSSVDGGLRNHWNNGRGRIE